jgi:hypothetical protein
VQWRCACRRHAEVGSLSYPHRLIGWLCRDCRRCPYRQGGIIAGHASTAVTHEDGEEAAVIGSDRRWSGVGKVSGSRDLRAVFAPLILQRGRAGCSYPKCCCLSHIDCRIGRLSCDRGRGRCSRGRWSWRRRCCREVALDDKTPRRSRETCDRGESSHSESAACGQPMR